MRVALCLSGQPRDLEVGVASIKRDLIDTNPEFEFDVFCHCWHSKSLAGKPFDSAQNHQDGKMGLWPSDPLSVLDALSPKDVFLEAPKPFFEFNEMTLTPDAIQPRLASLFYSMWMSNEMKKYYESRGDLYDVVIRTRYDIFFLEPLLLRRIVDRVSSGIFLPYDFQIMRMANMNGGPTMTDFFAVSNSQNMDAFNGVYPLFRDIYNQLLAAGAQPLGENYLGHQVRVNSGLQVIPSSALKVDFVRRIKI